jgi:hypothetical protein
MHYCTGVPFIIIQHHGLIVLEMAIVFFIETLFGLKFRAPNAKPQRRASLARPLEAFVGQRHFS